MSRFIQLLNRRIPAPKFGAPPSIPDERRGISIVELIVAGTMLGITMAALIPMLAVAAAERRAGSQEVIALQEVENQLELFLATGWDGLTTENATALRVTPETATYLPDAELTCTVANEDEPVPARRITMSLVWNDRFGQAGAPLQLTTWVYQGKETAE